MPHLAEVSAIIARRTKGVSILRSLSITALPCVMFSIAAGGKGAGAWMNQC